MRLRRLQNEGIEQFEDYLSTLTTEYPDDFPEDLLQDPALARLVEPNIDVETIGFETRFDVGEYLFRKLDGILNIDTDKKLWTWLALFYFRELCPEDTFGRRKPNEMARWILEIANFRTYYRHLLSGPFNIYRAYRDEPDAALALLCTRPDQISDVVEQLSSRQELVTNRSVVRAATHLYVDKASGKLKTHAPGKGPGSARRLADVVNQFDLTYDLYSMTTDEILDTLPAEFDYFKT